MRSESSTEGDYRIVAHAVHHPGRGYVAAVSVLRIRGGGASPRPVYLDDELADGYEWPSAAAARLYALARAQQVIRHEPHRLKR